MHICFYESSRHVPHLHSMLFTSNIIKRQLGDSHMSLREQRSGQESQGNLFDAEEGGGD